MTLTVAEGWKVLGWPEALFGEVWVPHAVLRELQEGRRQGHDVPDLAKLPWVVVRDPGAVPPEWLDLDLGSGELAAMALAIEHPGRLLLLDDALARRAAKAAGLPVSGTLKVLLEAKEAGLTRAVQPVLDRLIQAGLWVSEDLRRDILALAGE